MREFLGATSFVGGSRWAVVAPAGGKEPLPLPPALKQRPSAVGYLASLGEETAYHEGGLPSPRKKGTRPSSAASKRAATKGERGVKPAFGRSAPRPGSAPLAKARPKPKPSDPEQLKKTMEVGTTTLGTTPTLTLALTNDAHPALPSEPPQP